MVDAMSKRAKRGAGFVVIAVLLWLIAVPAYESDVPSLIPGVIGWAAILCTLYGLVTLAWGLIRD